MHLDVASVKETIVENNLVLELFNLFIFQLTCTIINWLLIKLIVIEYINRSANE